MTSQASDETETKLFHLKRNRKLLSDRLQKFRCVRLPRTDKNRTKTFSTIRGKLRVLCSGSASENQMEYRELRSQKLSDSRCLSQTRGRHDSTERHDRNHFKHATSDKRHARCVKSRDLPRRDPNTKQDDHFGKSDRRSQQHAHHRDKRHELWIQHIEHKREHRRQKDETEETTTDGKIHRTLGKF